MILLFLNIAVIIAVLSTLGGAEDFGGAFQAALLVLVALGLFDIFVAIPIWKAMLGKDDAPSTPALPVVSGTMRCPTCGADATVHGDQWECGWCGDCGVFDAAPNFDSAASPTVTARRAVGKETCAVILNGLGEDKIAAIKAIREWTGMNLKDVVDSVRQLPATLWTASADDARGLLQNLQRTGAVAELSVAAESIKKNRDAYPVVLCEIGKDKIAVVKVIREWTGLSLRDAVNYVNQTPITLRATSRDNAAQILHDLQEAGATVEMR